MRAYNERENLWESRNYFLCLSFLLDLDPQSQGYSLLTLSLILVILLPHILITDSV